MFLMQFFEMNLSVRTILMSLNEDNEINEFKQQFSSDLYKLIYKNYLIKFQKKNVDRQRERESERERETIVQFNSSATRTSLVNILLFTV